MFMVTLIQATNDNGYTNNDDGGDKHKQNDGNDSDNGTRDNNRNHNSGSTNVSKHEYEHLNKHINTHGIKHKNNTVASSEDITIGRRKNKGMQNSSSLQKT